MDYTLNKQSICFNRFTITSVFSSEEIPIGSLIILGTDNLIHQWGQEAGGKPIGIVLKTYRSPELPIYILEVALFNEYEERQSWEKDTVPPGAWTTWSSASIGFAGTCTGNINAKPIGESASSTGVSNDRGPCRKPKSDKSPSYDGDGSRWEDIAQEKDHE